MLTHLGGDQSSVRLVCCRLENRPRWKILIQTVVQNKNFVNRELSDTCVRWQSDALVLGR